jgi:hypothetical protein
MSMKRAATLVTVLGAAAIAACFTKPDAPHVGPGGMIDAAGDGTSVGTDGSPTMCGTHDNFDNQAATACGNWATELGLQITRSGTLSVAPNQMGLTAGCITKVPFAFGAGGTQIEILTPLVGYQQHTFFQVMAAGSTSQVVQIDMQGSGGAYVNASCNGVSAMMPVPYDGTFHRWWRFIPTSGDSTKVSIQSGSDGVNWSPFEVMTECAWGAVTATIDVSFGARVGQNVGGAAVFDNFNVRPCPAP